VSIAAGAVKRLALDCGFELAGIAPALPVEDFARFEEWRRAGKAAGMGYLTDRRGDLRSDPRNLLPEARSLLCVGKLYNTGQPNSIEKRDAAQGWISRYAWGADYHELLRERLNVLMQRIERDHGEPIAWRVCVDTAPLLERSYARLAGLGWIGRNTCLINEQQGSWLFLGEALLSIPLAFDTPAPFRCGTCRRCIDACPTEAIVAGGDGSWSVDSRLCISYLTIEERGVVPAEAAARTGTHVFGCDICQDVCPWNSRAPETTEEGFAPQLFAPWLSTLAGMTEAEFRSAFRHTPVWRAKYSGFLRNVAMAMGNSGRPEMLAGLERLAEHADSLVAQSAKQAIVELRKTISC